jgi:conjugative relaxase-like TrwC/TraI family protein
MILHSPPKSISIVALAGADERIVAAHDQAVWSAMRELENFAATRVRAGGGHGDRSTGNVAAGLFTHDTSNALEPHLHTHCVVFSSIFDRVEQRRKAGWWRLFDVP